MRHAAWWKPLAVVSALVLGAALVWHQTRLIAQGPTASPPPAASPENITSPEPEADPAPSAAEDAPRIIAPHPGGAYFSTSKSSAAMIPVFPAPVQRDGDEAQSRRSTYHSTSKSGALNPAIPPLWRNPFVYVPPVDSDRNAAQEEEATDE